MTVSAAEIADAIESCRRWVRRRYHTQPYCEDLEQEAAIGVLRAAEDYDPGRGAKFLTYARWWAYARFGKLSEKERAERYRLTHHELTRGEPPRRGVSLDHNDGHDWVLVVPPNEPDRLVREERLREARRCVAVAAADLSGNSKHGGARVALAKLAMLDATPHTEIAMEAGISRQWVATLQQRLWARARDVHNGKPFLKHNNRRKVACKYGHNYNENGGARVDAQGHRECRVCRRKRQNERNRRDREARSVGGSA